jgi:hypothetical protein
MEFFVHPWYMAAGGALISSPILIHLINRMRFKRVRWAAMEFLLKSQKKNRRKLIIEQLILLLLRILLVLLAAFLVARFLYGGTTSKGASHVVIVDDTLSMADRGKSGEKTTSAYSVAQDQLKQVVRNAGQASSAQFLRVFLLSDLETPLYEGRINDRTIDDLDNAFITRARKASYLHVAPTDGLKRGRALLQDVKDTSKILHFVSDFRDKDWAPGPDGDKAAEQLKGAAEDGVNVNLIDVAAPFRPKEGKTAQSHDNLAITEFKPDTRVAIEENDVSFQVKIMNHGAAEGRGYLQVYVNGQEDLTQAQILERLPAGREFTHNFILRFPSRNRPGLDITEKDSAQDRERKRRLQREYFQVRITIGAEPQGINADNVADLVMEVRKRVPVLLVDGNRPDRQGDGSDLHHLRAFAAGSGTYELEEIKLADLEKADLDLYPTIFLINVPELSPPAVAKLKGYVEQGGSLCYFLGEEIKSDHYNSVLFKAGLFPLQISEAPYDPLVAIMPATEYPDLDKRKEERNRLRTKDSSPKILFPKPDNPLVRDLVPWRPVFRYLGINYYWRALPRVQWDPEPHKAETLIVLPNSSSLDRYKEQALRLVKQAVEKTKQLAAREVEKKPYVEIMEGYERKVNEALLKGQIFALGSVLEEMLFDPGRTEEPRRPAMAQLWKDESMRGLEGDIKEFREHVLYGDPLLVSRPQGKGRVVALLTPAGTAPRKGTAGEDMVPWNNWGAGDDLVSQTYPMLLSALHRYLISEGQTPNRIVGEPIELFLDAERYERKVSWTFTPQPDLDASGGKVEDEKDNVEMEKSGKSLTFRFRKEAIRRPGIYRIQFTHVGEGNEDDRHEVRAFALNVDTSESDLKRTLRDRLEVSRTGKDARMGKVTLQVPGDPVDWLQERTKDASQPPWLYLFFVLILLVEQAMAVYLSFHLKSGEAATQAPAPQPAAAA